MDNDSDTMVGDIEPDAELLRRQVRSALSRAREAAGLTQKQTAKGLSWSVSKVVRIEQGNVPVTPTDVEAMLRHYGITDQSRIDELFELARRARSARSWDEYRSIMSPTFRELVGQESKAEHIYKHEPTFVPGVMQTEEYMHALLEALGNTGETKELKVKMRLQRQEMLKESVIPEFSVVIAEGVLRRLVGGTDIMRAQIQHLMKLNEHPKINIFLMPFDAGPHPKMGVPFTILQFGASLELEDVLYLEDGEHGSTSSEDRAKLEEYRKHYARIQELAEEAGTFADQAEQIMRELPTG